jgi:hypothetical protein
MIVANVVMKNGYMGNICGVVLRYMDLLLGCVLEEGVEASVISCNNDRANRRDKIVVLYCL